MPIEFTIDHEHATVHATAGGHISKTDLLFYVHAKAEAGGDIEFSTRGLELLSSISQPSSSQPNAFSQPQPSSLVLLG
jgi:hypothetical protein